MALLCHSTRWRAGNDILLSWLLKGCTVPASGRACQLPAYLARFKRLKHREPLLAGLRPYRGRRSIEAAACPLVYRLPRRTGS